MSTEKPIEVKRMTYTVPAAITGKDEQGRTTIICPHCHDAAYIDPSDGRVVCPTGEAISSLLAEAMPDLERQAFGIPEETAKDRSGES